MRNSQVEGLRCIAVLFVLIFHFYCRFQQIYMQGSMALPFPISSFGTIGVGIFLLISGYYFQKSKGGFSFVIKRIKKLYPTYCVSLLLIFVITHLYNLSERTVSVQDLLLNYLFLGGLSNVSYVDGAHWYLRTILFVIIIYSILQKLKKKVTGYYIVFTLLLSCKILCVCFPDFSISYYSQVLYSFASMDYFFIVLIGSGISLYTSDHRISGAILSLLSIIADGWCLGLFHSIMMIIFTIVFMLCLEEKLKFFNNKFTLLIAESSYSIYLIHQNIGFIILLILTNLLNYSYWMPLIPIITTIILGGLVHRFIELPINTRIDYLFNKGKSNEHA